MYCLLISCLFITVEKLCGTCAVLSGTLIKWEELVVLRLAVESFILRTNEVGNIRKKNLEDQVYKFTEFRS